MREDSLRALCAVRCALRQTRTASGSRSLPRPFAHRAKRITHDALLTHQLEIVLELDGVGDAEHDRHARLVETDVLEGERGRCRAGDVVALGARGHVPHRRMRDALEYQVAEELEGRGARSGELAVEAADLARDQLDRRILLRLERAAAQEAVAAVLVALQRVDLDDDLRAVLHDPAIRIGEDGAGYRLRRADR